MALGDQSPIIRVQVDQRLALESGVVGQVLDDASVSTEITYFDRVGDSYILEGVLAFSGAIESETREGEDFGQNAVAPIAYRLPFALRIPVDGQPNFLEVNTRIGEWDVKSVSPGYLQLQADLSIQGLNGRNGYSFYCGDQEDWVQPQVVTAQQEDEGYDEQEWMIEAKDERDEQEQDTLVYEPGSGWHEQLNTALQQPDPDIQGEEGDARAGEEAVQAEVFQEEAFQFEALADELVVDAGKASSAKSEAGVVTSAANAVVEAPAESVVAMADTEEEGQVASEDVAEDQQEMVAAPVEPVVAAATGPKLSLGAKKEEVAPVKLSGLLHGSVTKEFTREDFAEDSSVDEFAVRENFQDDFSRDEVLAKNTEEETLGADFDAVSEDSGSSIWGKWIQKESDAKYTLKFRIIQEAESLDEVANRYGTPIENLMRANGLTNEQVDIGQILLIPGRRR